MMMTPDYTFVVKKGDKYLAERFYHMSWTSALSKARRFISQQDVEKASITNDAQIVLIEMTEVAVLEPDNIDNITN
ncbi:hypothetical protein [uncultured Bartonella sp.]|uniref:hypothetical protein n=1 Tax=uncultured Bartonella sp. TaxID=104108 RepID=UPI0025F8EC5E|nr:hypothetical protein [uncultured Bartonella sp.]